MEPRRLLLTQRRNIKEHKKDLKSWTTDKGVESFSGILFPGARLKYGSLRGRVESLG